MENLDGRRISPEAMEQMRIRAVRRVQHGESPEKVIAALGFSRACIYNWLARYRNGGQSYIVLSRKK
jgi:transposase